MATSIMMMSALSNVAVFIEDARIGSIDAEWQTRSPLASLLMPGETVLLATTGRDGGALFTSHRLLVSQEAGMLTKRPVIKAIRRSAVDGYIIDRDDGVTLALRGAGFGAVTLIFSDENFDPMKLTPWLGGTLAPGETEKAS